MPSKTRHISRPYRTARYASIFADGLSSLNAGRPLSQRPGIHLCHTMTIPRMNVYKGRPRSRMDRSLTLKPPLTNLTLSITQPTLIDPSSFNESLARRSTSVAQHPTLIPSINTLPSLSSYGEHYVYCSPSGRHRHVDPRHIQAHERT